MLLQRMAQQYKNCTRTTHCCTMTEKCYTHQIDGVSSKRNTASSAVQSVFVTSPKRTTMLTNKALQFTESAHKCVAAASLSSSDLCIRVAVKRTVRE